MKMDFIKSVENNFNSLKISTNKETSKLNESKNTFKNSLDSLKGNGGKKIKSQPKEDDKDDYVKEALEFLNSLVNKQNNEINNNKNENNESKQIGVKSLIEMSYELKSGEVDNSKKLILDGNASKEDLLKEGKLLEVLSNLSKELQMLLNGEKSGINKEELLKKLKNVENSLNISNKDILDLIKNRLQNLEESINKLGFKLESSDVTNLVEKLQTTEKLMKNLVQKQIKLNKDVLNKDETKDFEKLLKSIEEKSSDKLIKSFKETPLTESTSKEDIIQSKEEKLLNDIIKGTQSDNKSKHSLFYNVAQKNNDNNLKIESMGSIKATSQNPIDGVIKTVKYMNINNLQELTVKINPAELGDLTIKLTMGSDGMKASILASNKDTYNLLNANINDLKNALNQQNIKVIDVFINLNNNNNNEESANFQNQYNEANLNNKQNGNGNQREENKNVRSSNQGIDEIKIDEEKEDSLINAFV